ncbi:hypothetical protein BKH43_06410 [Helicobacter sp. 13S00401-1]|uniref:DUF3240 family protein n=1 Tax=Helicobacter sp. 13S00401-1 TaxID=1905758 RepID=UPI000BA7ABF7|nr:DUF3240 family protein [Helicobacter sp. 13S00401-1]PAF49718.1 hypothetical protein BKH43_06410 [Helicobacter sp. 13S00401-1]
MVMLDIHIKSIFKDNIVDLFLEHGYNDFFYIDSQKYASKTLLASDKERVSGRQEFALIKFYVDEVEAQNVAALVLKHFEHAKVYKIECSCVICHFEPKNTN